MKNTIYCSLFISALLHLFIFSSCGDETVTPITNNTDSCGSPIDSNRVFNIFGGISRLPYNYLQGTNRVYNFYSHYDSICTDQHSVATYSASFYNNSNIQCYGAVEWALLYQNIDSGSYIISTNETRWDGDNTVGFKTPFGEFAADCYVNVYLRFPTQGSPQADSVYLVTKVLSVSYRFQYKLHKPSTTQAGNLINSKNYNELKYIYENKNNYQINLSDKRVIANNKSSIVPQLFLGNLF